MQSSLTGTFRSFLAKNLNAEVRELYASVAILDFAVSAVMIFEPIYLYSLGYSLLQILFFWLAIYVLYFFAVPIGAKFAERFGFEHCIAFSSIFLILYYLCLFSVKYYWWSIFPAIIFLVIGKFLYWPSYHGNFAKYSVGQEQGREISNLMVLDSLVYILGPLMGGLIIELSGFKVLFVVVSFLILLSNLPMLITPEKFEKKKFAYGRPFKEMWKKENILRTFSYLGYGEELLALVIWPVFIFLVFKDYLSIGSFAAVSTLIATLAVFYVGRTTDKRDKSLVLRFSAMIYSFSWFLRLIIQTVSGVFLADFLARISKQSLSIPLVSMVYERARQEGVMEGVVVYEMSLVLGKIIAAVLAIVILYFFRNLEVDQQFAPIFIIAGLMTLLYTVSKNNDKLIK